MKLALMVAQLVERHGIGARAEKADALSITRIFGLDTKDIALVCLCYVENATAAQIRYAIRRLRRKAPNAIIMVALVGNTDNMSNSEDPQASLPLDFVERSLSATVARILAVGHDSHGAETFRTLPMAG
jgi:hypothetical protein